MKNYIQKSLEMGKSYKRVKNKYSNFYKNETFGKMKAVSIKACERIEMESDSIYDTYKKCLNDQKARSLFLIKRLKASYG